MCRIKIKTILIDEYSSGELFASGEFTGGNVVIHDIECQSMYMLKCIIISCCDVSMMFIETFHLTSLILNVIEPAK